MLNKTTLLRVDLNLLVLFEAVFAERHVGRAAARMQLSASAISHGLRRLRDMLGDPLFLKHPKGVMPTARALELAEPIAAILAQVKNVVGSAAPFDPATSARRFTLGAPDALLAVIMPPLLASIRRTAPNIDLSVRQLQTNPWERVFEVLDAHVVDIVVAPLTDVPPRFAARTLFEEEFVIAMRAGHPLAQSLTLQCYCNALHLVVSPIGDPHGHIDRLLAKQKMSRRVVLAVPNFMLALAAIAETDLIGAIPARLVKTHAARFDIVGKKPPFAMKPDRIRAVAPKVALMDAGVAWLFGRLGSER